MRRSLGVLATLLVMASPAAGQSVRQVFRTAPTLVGLPGLANGPYRNASDVILEQAIRNLPLHPAASSAYTHRWDAAQGALVRVDDTVAAWPYTERGQTLGEGLLNIGVTWGYFDVDSFNGNPLGHDPFPVWSAAAPRSGTRPRPTCSIRSGPSTSPTGCVTTST